MKVADRERGPARAPEPGGRDDGTPPGPVIGATISTVQETAAEAITKLIYTYAERIDDGDFAGIGELFAHATLTFEGFGDAVTGHDAIERLFTRSTRRYEDGTPRTKHVMTNVMVDVADDGSTASSSWYFTVLQAVPGALALQPVIAGRCRHTLRAGGRAVAGDDDAHHHRPRGRTRAPPALRPGAMKLSLVLTGPAARPFWALYFDPAFIVRLHLECLGSTSAEVLCQEGDLSGMVRTLRYSQRPKLPGPVRKIFGEEITTTEVSTSTRRRQPQRSPSRRERRPTGRTSRARSTSGGRAAARSRSSPSTPASRSSAPGRRGALH